MKSGILIIIVIAISSLFGYVQYVDARCSPNEGWPGAPCYGCPTCYSGLEQEKVHWEPYYDFKGKEFMESKLHQLQIEVNNNTLQGWIDKSPTPQERENVRHYYFLNGLMPDFHGMYFDQALEQENRDKLLEIVNVEFIDLSYENMVGVPIQFVLEKTAYSNCNSFDVKITDENGNFVWAWGVEAMCNPSQNPILVTSYIKIGNNKDHPIIINESGKYYIEIEIDNMIIKKEFSVRQIIAGSTIDRTIYQSSPLKQIKSGIATDKIRCNEGLILIYKHNQMPTCIKFESILKLAERGWISETDNHSLLALKKVSDSCANDSPKERMANPLMYSNGTHVFLNLGCEWKKIGVYLGELENEK